MQANHNVTRITSLKVRALTLLMCSSSAGLPNAAASTFTYNLGYRADYSTNIYRVPDDQKARRDLINTLTGGFTYLQNTSTFNTRVAGSVAYFDYYRDSFDAQNNITLDAYGELFFVPQVLSWVAADGFRKVQIDPRQADLPTNRQNSNVFLTGPNIYMHLGPVDTLTLEARYGRSGIESFDVDSERDFLAARWLHRLSAWSTLMLNYEFMDVDYENSVLNTDFIRHNYFLRGNIRSARNDFTFDVGKTRINLARGAPIDNLLFRLAATRQLNSVSSLGIHYGREYSDTGMQLLPSAATSQPTPGGIQAPLGTDIVTNELFYTEQTELFYSWRGNTFPWTARVFSRNIDYELSPSSREEKGWSVDARYVLTNALSLVATSGYVYTNYNDRVSEIWDSITGAGVLYRLSRSLSAGIDVRRYGRTSTVSTQEYTDDRISATLTYSAQSAAP